MMQLRSWDALQQTLAKRVLRTHKYPDMMLLGTWLASLYPKHVRHIPLLVQFPVQTSDDDDLSNDPQSYSPFQFISRAAMFGRPGQSILNFDVNASVRMSFATLSSAVGDSSRMLKRLRLSWESEVDGHTPQNTELPRSLYFSHVAKHLVAVAIATGLGGRQILENNQLDILTELEEWQACLDRFGFGAARNHGGRPANGQFAAVRIYTIVAVGKMDSAENLFWESCKLNRFGEPDWLSLAYVLVDFCGHRRRDDVFRVFEEAYWGTWREQCNLGDMSGMAGFPFVNALCNEGSRDSRTKAQNLVERMAMEVFDPNVVEMLRSDVSGDFAERIVKECVHLVAVLARTGQLSRAIAVMEAVVALGLRFRNGVSIAIILRAAHHCSAEERTRTMRLFALLRMSGPSMAGSCYSLAISLYAHDGNVGGALSILKAMQTVKRDFGAALLAHLEYLGKIW
ncbi:hypothetical protein M427DRAFT_46991 [Gonapodya prolifera JEL478]|uniref:Uncharacterized protein n=1 Tax=Gonapodya prolifera (strain JEL478) TaxID=1344416 RepID=A0A139A5D9_GONPJ|nr:hypothetical protein M427DRAFT_46991 [Gonapodya prolifera JEL478]|eukprot:KXS11613.1 hypothetical protein M427DRAFT_46991 [Gonapodya prolifera JEL478]